MEKENFGHESVLKKIQPENKNLKNQPKSFIFLS